MLDYKEIFTQTEINAIIDKIVLDRPHFLTSDSRLKSQINLAESMRAFGDDDTWVNKMMASRRAEQDARKLINNYDYLVNALNEAAKLKNKE